MRDLVLPYLLRKDSTELKYCLRSVEKHLSGVRHLWIVGSAPQWLKNASTIKCADLPYSKSKEFNIFNKIRLACRHPEVSETFIMINDDHMLLQDFDAANFPVYHRGLLYDAMKKNHGNNYRSTLNHSRQLLIKNGKEPLDYDIHCPSPMTKSLFEPAFAEANWKIPYGYAIKSLFYGMSDIPGTLMTDCKINSRYNYREIKDRIAGRPFFSTGGLSDDMRRVLEELYPESSRYETK